MENMAWRLHVEPVEYLQKSLRATPEKSLLISASNSCFLLPLFGGVFPLSWKRRQQGNVCHCSTPRVLVGRYMRYGMVPTYARMMEYGMKMIYIRVLCWSNCLYY